MTWPGRTYPATGGNDEAPSLAPRPYTRPWQHGSFAGYAAGCRCEPCVSHRRAYDLERYHRLKPPSKAELKRDREWLEAASRVLRPTEVDLLRAEVEGRR